MKDSKVATGPLDAIYEFVLTRASDTEMVEPEELADTKLVLACILSARMPLSITALAEILGRKPDVLRESLRRLRSVVHVPDEVDQPGLRTVHTSLGDYLLGRAAAELRISAVLGDESLAAGCFRVMGKRLHFNVSQSNSSYAPNPPTKPDSITHSLEYVCLQWAYHLANLRQPWIRDSDINSVFLPRFLFWLEVMSVLCQVQRAGAMLIVASTTVQSIELARFMRDANTFVASSRIAIERSAPHIYLSALPFAAKDSLVYTFFSSRCTGLVSVKTLGSNRHGGRLVMSIAGHAGRVESIAYLPDGRLASGSADGTVRIWNMRTGDESMPHFASGDGDVHSVAVALTGKSLASGSEGVVCIWNLEAPREPPRRLLGHIGPVHSVAFSPDGQSIASVGRDGLRLWRVETGQQLSVTSETMAGVHAVAFAPDGKIIASRFKYDKEVRLWSFADVPTVVHVLDHEAMVSSMCFSPDGTKLATYLKNSTIQLWSMEFRKSIATLRGYLNRVQSIQFSPDGGSLLSVSDDTGVQLWKLDRDSNDITSIFLGGQWQAITSASLSPDGLYIALTYYDSTIQIWDASINHEATQAFPAHDRQVRSMCVSDNGAFIVSGSWDRSARIWDAHTGEPKLPPLIHERQLNSVAVSPDSRLIASAAEDNMVRLWDIRTGELVGEPLRGHTDAVFEVTFTRNSNLLASASDDQTVRIWDVVTKRLSTIGPFHYEHSVRCVAISPDNKLVAAGDLIGDVHLWNTDSRRGVRDPYQQNECQSSKCPVTFSPTGTLIACGGGDGIVRIWDIGADRLNLTLIGHTRPVASIAYSPTGLIIGSGSEDFTVRLWDAVGGTQLAVLCGHFGVVESLAFMPDGNSIVSGSGDSTIRVWDMVTALARSPKDIKNASEAVESTGLTEVGWLLGRTEELLLWVPTEYRAYLNLPSCKVLIAKHHVFMNTEDIWHHGENWTACWLGMPAF